MERCALFLYRDGCAAFFLSPWRRVPDTAFLTAALALTAAAAALAAAALALAAAALAIYLPTIPRHVGGWASSVPVSRRRSRKHPQRRGERRCVGRRPSSHQCVDRCD